MRILFVTNLIPYPPTSGAQLRPYHLLRRITANHQVWLATHVYQSGFSERLQHLEKFCQKIIVGKMKKRSRIERLPGLISYLLKGKPPELRLMYSDELASKIQLLCSEIAFDVVQIEESCMALYLNSITLSDSCKYILSFYDIIFDRYARYYDMERTQFMKWRKYLHGRMMRGWEPYYAERFDRCITVSCRDRQLLKRANPRLKVNVVPNGVDIKEFQPLPYDDNKNILFLGKMDYLPNLDAALYLYNEIFPRVKMRIPDAEMWVVGENPSDELCELGYNGLHVTGRVDDVLPYYQQCSVCAVPLRSGGGTRLKILEAMALGRPIVTTTIGCEGLDVVDGEHLLIADAPKEFADQVIRVLTDRHLREYLTRNSRQLVVSKYSWDTIAERLMQIYDSLYEAITD
jgi:sugar transferase (PEP-CTERM/EpsH1 system associated)